MEQLRFLVNEGRTLAQAALQFVLANSAVTCAIPSAKDLGQSDANAAAADSTLSDGDLARLAGLSRGW